MDREGSILSKIFRRSRWVERAIELVSPLAGRGVLGAWALDAVESAVLRRARAGLRHAHFLNTVRCRWVVNVPTKGRAAKHLSDRSKVLQHRGIGSAQVSVEGERRLRIQIVIHLVAAFIMVR